MIRHPRLIDAKERIWIMELINGADRLPEKARPLYLALGNFDGVHRGHQAILKSAVRQARKAGGCSAALIFNPHPGIALRPDQPVSLLTDIADRAEIMSELELDFLIIEPFTLDFAMLNPDQFVKEYLWKKFKVSGIFIGDNYKFGRKGTGNVDTLNFWAGKLGFQVEASPIIRFKGREVSSSLIRSLLLKGDVREAADYLNYYFFRHGKVVTGYGIGKKLVYPTANISASPALLWPGKGVYLTAVGKVEERLLYGVTNVGSRPTFSDYSMAVETHIIDYNDQIYNRDIRLCFLEKLRDTKVFSSPAGLKAEISRDIAQARELIPFYQQEKNGNELSLQAGCSVLRS
jgi:riboflavin kinase / FMN adenylyltransferase